MRVGKYVVPKFRLDISARALFKLNQSYPNGKFTRGEMAKALGVGIRNGTFNEKVRDLQIFNLILPDLDKFIITDLGRSVIQNYGDTTLAEKIIKSVPLWAYFLNKYNDKLGKEDFIKELKSVAQITDAEVKKKGNQVFNNYNAAIKLIRRPTITARAIELMEGPPKNETSQTIQYETLKEDTGIIATNHHANVEAINEKHADLQPTPEPEGENISKKPNQCYSINIQGSVLQAKDKKSFKLLLKMAAKELDSDQEG